jgi:hypothetical protein
MQILSNINKISQLLIILLEMNTFLSKLALSLHAADLSASCTTVPRELGHALRLHSQYGNGAQQKESHKLNN